MEIYINSPGLFTTKDTHPPNYSRPLSINRYLYVEGNPVNAIDPYGRISNCHLATVIPYAVCYATGVPPYIQPSGASKFYRPDGVLNYYDLFFCNNQIVQSDEWISNGCGEPYPPFASNVCRLMHKNRCERVWPTIICGVERCKGFIWWPEPAHYSDACKQKFKNWCKNVYSDKEWDGWPPIPKCKTVLNVNILPIIPDPMLHLDQMP